MPAVLGAEEALSSRPAWAIEGCSFTHSSLRHACAALAFSPTLQKLSVCDPSIWEARREDQKLPVLNEICLSTTATGRPTRACVLWACM